MKYSELLHFEPVESVVQLREAANNEYAFNLLDTYVISDRMAEMIDEIIIEQLQFQYPADNKGLLIVGNYGTGKSHLMSVISTIAEVEGASQRLSNARVSGRAGEIEGKFKVIRSEIGSITMSLRDFICEEISEKLQDMGVDYTFPPLEKVRSNKDAFMEMMGKFHEVYPEKGLLLIVDELLDYLRSRNGQEVILDLGFLRELGEICRFSRFRFISGVQEMLFDNPRFQFVAEQLRRVKERFEQVSIIREDIAYVVSQRLLKKDEKQKALIREHLQKFTPLYDKLNERIEEFVSLFPIHPSYLSTFEKVIVAEKRVVLKTISNEMKKLLDQEVPEDQPGLISYDSYWQYIENDVSLKSNPDIRQVMSKSRILQDRVQNAFTKPVYKPIALRIIRALSVNRLTTGDIFAKLGATSEELRDSLFLYADLPEKDSVFLRSTIETVLKEILKTVSWQYISFNEANGQYFLDLKKDIAVDDLIEQKAETLSNDQLDRYYFEVLEQLTDRSKSTYVTGYRIWAYELPWWTCKVTRQGYLFFGAPNDRSTAQPPKDFYIFMLQLFEIPRFKDENRSDEVFFRLKIKDEKFIRALKLYAGSREMAATAATGTRNLYEQKGTEYLQGLTKWLRDNFLNAFEVTYRGKTKKVVEWTNALPPHSGVREIIDNVSSACLSIHFDEKYPEYPRFSKLNTVLTKENLPSYIQDAFKYLNGAVTKGGAAILSGFVLMEDESIKVGNSGYARWIIELLDEKGPGQVVNRSEIIEIVYTMQGTLDVELTRRFSIEPELFSVVLAALVYNGDIVLTIAGTQYDAMKFEQLIRLPINDIINFSHIKRPSGLPMQALQALFDFFEIKQFYLQQQHLQSGIIQLNDKVTRLLNELVLAMQAIKEGIPYWDGALLSKTEQQQYGETLDEYKDFLESLLVYNSPAKLNNFKYSANDINARKKGADLVEKVKRIQNRINESINSANYLISASQHLPDDHEWLEEARVSLEELAHAIKNELGYPVALLKVREVKKRYQDIYMGMHNRARLNATQDNRKTALLNDRRLKTLGKLSEIAFLPKTRYEGIVNSINSLSPCWSLTKELLDIHSICPNCRFRPKEDKSSNVDNLGLYENRIQETLEEWIALLIRNLKDSRVMENISLIEKHQQTLVKEFIDKSELPMPIEPDFIDAINTLLRGIEKIGIGLDELKALMGNGSPMSVEEVRKNFEKLMKDKIGDKQTNSIRIILEQ